MFFFEWEGRPLADEDLMTAREARVLANRLKDRGILTIETYRGSGPGGQHRNRTESGVRLTGSWRIDGEPVMLVAQACLKSQHGSMRAALGVLLSRLRAEIERRTHRGRETANGWGGKYVRTYHEPDNRVTDHASGTVFSYAATVGKKSLAAAIDARRRSAVDEGVLS